MTVVEIHLNGEARRTAARTLDQLLDELGYAKPRRGIAVALNGRIVPRGRHDEQTLAAGDRIELVGAVQGG